MSFRDIIPSLVETFPNEIASAPICVPPEEVTHRFVMATEIESITSEPTFRDHIVAKETLERLQLEEAAGIKFFETA